MTHCTDLHKASHFVNDTQQGLVSALNKIHEELPPRLHKGWWLESLQIPAFQWLTPAGGVASVRTPS